MTNIVLINVNVPNLLCCHLGCRRNRHKCMCLRFSFDKNPICYKKRKLLLLHLRYLMTRKQTNIGTGETSWKLLKRGHYLCVFYHYFFHIYMYYVFILDFWCFVSKWVGIKYFFYLIIDSVVSFRLIVRWTIRALIIIYIITMKIHNTNSMKPNHNPDNLSRAPKTKSHHQ